MRTEYELDLLLSDIQLIESGIDDGVFCDPVVLMLALQMYRIERQ